MDRGSAMIETFITSATLEVRFMPPIPADVAVRAAQAMLAELRAMKSDGAQAHVISREDHLSISIEDVEPLEMTGESYSRILDRLKEIARQISRDV